MATDQSPDNSGKPAKTTKAKSRTGEQEEQHRRERNVTRTFSFALAIGVIGLSIFAFAASKLPEAKTAGASTPTQQRDTALPGGVANEEQPPLPPTVTSEPEEAGAPSQPTPPCDPIWSADTAKPEPWTIVGLGLLAGGAASLVGALVGFLFGLPRTPNGTSPRPPRQTTEGSDAASNAGVAAASEAHTTLGASANNNLIEISDWLAKIIVGAGLVGLKDLTGWIGTTGTALGAGAGLGCGYMAGAFGATVIMYFFTWGFLFTYVHTRTVVSRILASTEAELLSRLEKQDRRQEEVEARLGSVTERVKEVKQDVSAVQSDVDQKVDKLAEENRIFTLLYSNDPAAPRQVVSFATEYLQKPGNENNARIWLYLACAYGQLHALAPDAEKAGLADEALKALTRAIELDPNLRSIARGLLDASYPDRFPGDDDLLTLWGDQRFKDVVLAPPPPASSQGPQSEEKQE